MIQIIYEAKTRLKWAKLTSGCASGAYERKVLILQGVSGVNRASERSRFPSGKDRRSCGVYNQWVQGGRTVEGSVEHRVLLSVSFPES